MRDISDRKLATGIFLLTFVAYAWFFGGGGWNQNSTFDLTRALVEQQTIRIDGLPWNTGDFSKIGDRIYSNKPPGLSLLAVPPYAAARGLEIAMGLDPTEPMLQILNLWIITVVTCATSGAALAAAFFLYARQDLGATRRSALGVSLILAFGTYVLAYSTVLFNHVPSALFLFLSYALARRHPVRSGLCAGIAVLCNYLPIVALPVVALIVAARDDRWRNLLSWCLGGLPSAILLLAYQNAAFGSPWKTATETQNPIFNEERLWLGFLQLPRPSVLAELAFGPYRGLFFISPVLLLAVIGAVRMWRQPERRAEVAACVVIVGTFFLVNSSFNGWHGGFAIGPRYIVPVVPFLGIPMLFATTSLRPVWIALTTWSVIVNFVVTAVNPLPSYKVDRPIDQYLFPLFITGRIPPDTPPTPLYEWKIMTGHVSVSSWAPDETFPYTKHPAGSRESFWASFNLGETVFPGSPWSVLPIALWIAAGSAWLCLVARE